VEVEDEGMKRARLKAAQELVWSAAAAAEAAEAEANDLIAEGR